MKESEYAPIILETIGSNGASIGTLKTSCGQGNKISNMRKALYRLLKEGKIEFNGYDKEFTKFSYDGIMLKKVNPNITNPIFVKGLLDNPLKDDNYLKITKIFKKRIDDINRIYNYEIKTLENIMDKMPLKKAIKLGYIKSDDAYTKSHNRKDVTKNNEKGIITFDDILKEHPGTEIYYLNGSFKTDLAFSIDFNSKEKYPYFGSKTILYYDGKVNWNFLKKYKSYFSHLPINDWGKKRLFEYFIIGALKEKGENKDDRLWKLASLLAETDHVKFVEKLRVLEYINENEVDNFSDNPRFLI